MNEPRIFDVQLAHIRFLAEETEAVIRHFESRGVVAEVERVMESGGETVLTIKIANKKPLFMRP